MQTFLPHPSFALSAAALDDRRLGKQRVETLQILRALHIEDYGWARHPAVLMWRGCTRALVAYGLAVVDAWCGRGHTDTTRPAIGEFAAPCGGAVAEQLGAAEMPPWLGWDPLHRSHRAALVRKDPRFYRSAFPDVSPDEPYVWPRPPAGPPPQRPFTAWVVRPTSTAALRAFGDQGCVGVPAEFGGPGATRKQRRQAACLTETVAAGDRVASLDGGDLLCGIVGEPTATRMLGGQRHLTRPVAWDGTLPRSALERPYQLQDPRVLFALRGEPAVAAVGGR